MNPINHQNKIYFRVLVCVLYSDSNLTEVYSMDPINHKNNLYCVKL